jgi:hypothetical protein
MPVAGTGRIEEHGIVLPSLLAGAAPLAGRVMRGHAAEDDTRSGGRVEAPWWAAACSRAGPATPWQEAGGRQAAGRHMRVHTPDAAVPQVRRQVIGKDAHQARSARCIQLVADQPAGGGTVIRASPTHK